MSSLFMSPPKRSSSSSPSESGTCVWSLSSVDLDVVVGSCSIGIGVLGRSKIVEGVTGSGIAASAGDFCLFVGGRDGVSSLLSP